MKSLFLAALLLVAHQTVAQLAGPAQLADLFGYCPNNKFIVFGEAHGVACNRIIELEAVGFQLKKGRTVHFLMEMGFGSEQAYNRYLNNPTADSTLLIGNRIKNDFMRSLWQLNKQYPGKLFVHGIDCELELVPYLNELVEATKGIEDRRVRKYMDRLTGFRSFVVVTKSDKRKFRNAIRHAVDAVDDYLSFHGSKDEHLKRVAAIGKTSFYLRKNRRKPNLRDAFMYENVQVLLKKYPDDFFYLQIGAFHAFTNTQKENYTGGLCYKLNHEPRSLIKGNVFSIGMAMINCRSNYWENTLTTIDKSPNELSMEAVEQLKNSSHPAPAFQIFVPAPGNPFDLYLIAINQPADELFFPKNFVHLFRN